MHNSLIRAPTCGRVTLKRPSKRSEKVLCSADPLWRFFGGSEDSKDRIEQKLAPGQMEVLHPRGYQQELIEVAKDGNVLIALPTGSGKTLIAAEVIRRKLPALRAARKAVIFLAPTNPLVEQQAKEILTKKHGLQTMAFHGDVRSHKITSWSEDSWQSELSKVDVVVMTPAILCLALCHGSIQMRNIGLLVFDEAHHCGSDHHYAQIMEDFYHRGTSPADSRPQILALTASPKTMGALEDKINAKLVTVADHCRAELAAEVPVPANQLVKVEDAGWPSAEIEAACAQLEAAQKVLSQAAACETLAFQLQKQAMLAKSGQLQVPAGVQPNLECFADVSGAENTSLTKIDRQVRAVRTCLLQLGPWAGAAAAYLDLLSGAEDDAAGQQDDDVGDGQTTKAEATEGQADDDDSEDDDDSAGVGAPAVNNVVTEADLWKHMNPDNLGEQPEQLIQKFGSNMLSVYTWLAETSITAPHIVTPQELTAAMAAAHNSSGSPKTYPPAAWAAVWGGLSGLLAKAAVMLVMSALADLLILDKDKFVSDPGLQAAAGDAGKRCNGGLRRYGKTLMEQVSFATLQAQMFPDLPCSRSAPCWRGGPLLSPKVIKLVQHLEYQRRARDGGADDWWSVMVFLETKLATIVICKLVQSLPDMRDKLRAGYLIGDTEPGGATSNISMNNKAQAAVVQHFRKGDNNVLFATNVGSEGMDFKQCQAVVAFDPPNNVTTYIQARGRARKAGSFYYWLAPDSQEVDPKKAVSRQMSKLQQEAEQMEQTVRQRSTFNRGQLRSAPAAPYIQPYDVSEHYAVPSGGVVTMRQAQVLLAAFCAQLPGSDRDNLLQAYYSIRQTTPGQPNSRFAGIVYMPSNSGILEPLEGPHQSKKAAAKSAAAFEAVKQLRQIGKLDKWLQPTWVSSGQSAQLEAEPIPKFMYDCSLEPPLGARPVTFQGTREKVVTMHLHTFVLTSNSSTAAGSGGVSESEVLIAQQQQHQVGTKRPLEALTAAAQSMMRHFTHSAAPEPHSSSSSSSPGVPDVLNLAVGAPDRCAAVPGRRVAHSSGSSSSSRTLQFGVLLWEPLPADSSDMLQWPAWTHKDQKEPHQVTVSYEGAVCLTPHQLLLLMHHQQATDDHINWSSKRMLGIRPQADKQQSAWPLQPQHVQHITQSWGAPAATTDATAAELLAGAQLCYLFAPLRQQQQHHQVDWQVVEGMSQGLKSFADIAAESCGLAASAGRQPPTVTAAAVAAVPAELTAEQLSAPGAQLTDRIVIAGHSSILYRCTGIDHNMTLTTPVDFSWRDDASSTAATAHSASSHAQYYAQRYGVTGLNSTLPMLSIGGGRGWRQSLGLLEKPLRPPLLQNDKAKRGGQSTTRGWLTTPEAADAAKDLFGVVQQQQQQQQQQQAADKPLRAEHLPLELCWFLPLSATAWSELLLLPVFMYRINTLLRVHKMRQKLKQLASGAAAMNGSAGGPVGFAVPDPGLLTVALTGSRAGEVFDQEGLEYLGDVVLKFIATNYLLQSEDASLNEGELSVEKARLVRNVSLAETAQLEPLLLQRHLHLLPYVHQQHTGRGRNAFTPTGRYPKLAAVDADADSRGRADVHQELLGLCAAGSEALLREQKGKRLADGVEALIGAVYLTAAAAGGSYPDAASSSGAAPPVSAAGISAAAAFCEAVGVMPKGSAALACKPPLQAFHTSGQGQAFTELSPQLHRMQQLLHYKFNAPTLLHQAVTHVSVFGAVSYQRLEFLGDALLDLAVSGWLMNKLAAALRQQQDECAHVYAPAVLTQARAALVNNTNLGRAAAFVGLHQFINARSRQLGKEIRRFAAVTVPGQLPQQTGSMSVRASRGLAVVATAQTAEQGVSGTWCQSDCIAWNQIWGGILDGTKDDAKQQDGELTAVGENSVRFRPPKAIADVVESIIGAMFVDSSCQQRQKSGHLGWDVVWSAVQQLLKL